MIYTIVFGRRRCIIRETIRPPDFRQTRLLARNDSGTLLPTLFVLDLASKGIFLCMNEYSVLQVIAQDLENTVAMKNPKKENMTSE